MFSTDPQAAHRHLYSYTPGLDPAHVELAVVTLPQSTVDMRGMLFVVRVSDHDGKKVSRGFDLE